MSLYIDLSEFLAVPMKTGIQRIGGEICRCMPPDVLTPVRLQSDRYVALPSTLIGAIGRYFGNADQSTLAEISRLSIPISDKPVAITSKDTVLVTEIFGQERAAFFQRMPEEELRRCRFVVYDLLPMTHPEFFPPEMPLMLSAYYQNISRASNCGFISEYTREMYYGRLKRTSDRGGVVLPLGCDALGARAAQLSLNRPLTFSVLGTVEPRKNHGLILEAFEPLLQQINGLKLCFIGKMGWVDGEFAQKVRALAADKNSGFHFFSAPDDVAVRGHIEQSRATIYASTAEGYGLPPVESLWAGTPVIASVTIPSVQELGSTAGIHFVDPLNVVNLRRAILAFLDDDYANQMTKAIVSLELPTWHAFTENVLHWCRNDLA